VGFSKGWPGLEEIKNFESLSSVLLRLCLGTILCVFIFLAFLGLNAIQEHAREDANRVVESSGLLRRMRFVDSGWPADSPQISTSQERQLDRLHRNGDQSFPLAQGQASLPSSNDSLQDNTTNARPFAAVGVSLAQRHETRTSPLPSETIQSMQGLESTPPNFFSFFEHENNEELSVQEALGFRGPFMNVVTNTIIVLISNALVIDVFAIFPLFLGRFGIAKIRQGLGKMIALFIRSSLALQYLAKRSFFQQGSGWVRSLAASARAVNTPNIFYIFLGYFFFICITATWLWAQRKMFCLSDRHSRSRMRAIYWAATFTHIMARTILVMQMEFIILPIFFGIAVDLFAIPSGALSATTRLHVVAELTSKSLFMHWAIGVLYISALSVFISILREVLHPRLLRFLRDPNDPDFDPLKEIVNRPLAYHFRRLGLSALLYAPIIGITVYAPMELARALGPDLFPLQFTSGFGFAGDVIFCIIEIIFVMPGLVHTLKMRFAVRSAIQVWFHHSSVMLGLQHLVLREENRRSIHADQPRVDGDGHCGGPGQTRCPLSLRILILIVLTLALVVVGLALSLIIPLRVARFVYAHLRLLIGHEIWELSDIVLFLSGLTGICTCFGIVQALRRSFRQGNFSALVITTAENTLRALGITSASALWFVLLPYLLGRIIELSLALTDWRPTENYALICVSQTWLRGLLLQRLLTPILFHSGPHERSRRLDLSECILPERVLLQRSADTSQFLWELVHVCVFTACFAALPSLVHSFLGDDYVQSRLFGALRLAYISLQAMLLWALGRSRLYVFYRFLAEQIRNKRYLVTMRLLDFSEQPHLHQE
jgi:hypothetical protein